MLRSEQRINVIIFAPGLEMCMIFIFSFLSSLYSDVSFSFRYCLPAILTTSADTTNHQARNGRNHL